MTVEKNVNMQMLTALKNAAEGLAGVQEKHTERAEKAEGASEILNGESVTFEEGGQSPVDAKARVSSIHTPGVNAADELDLAEKICDRLNSANEVLKNSVGDVKKYTGAAHAMLKASGVNIDATTKVFFDIFALMALMLETAQRQRAAAREVRQAELNAAVTSINKQADKQVEAAQERFNAATASAAITIASGAVTVGMSVYGGVQGMKGAKFKTEAKDYKFGIGNHKGEANPELAAEFSAKAKELFAKQTTVKGLADGLSAIGNGIGQMVAAKGNLKAETIQAEATREQAVQKEADAAIQDANEAMQTAQEVINTVTRVMMQVHSSQVEMMKQLHFA